MTDVETNFNSGLRLKKLYFEKINFQRSANISNSIKLKLRVSKEITEQSDAKGTIYNVLLKVIVFDDLEDFKLGIDCVGQFVVDGFDEGINISEIIKKNTVSIMFPYVRSQISLVTSQPDLMPVILPVINVHSLIKEDNAERDNG